jgi:RND family efflux transporter MFP subunit
MGNTVNRRSECNVWALMTAAMLATFACSKGQGANADSGAATALDSTAATPVHLATVERGNVLITVSGPGRTDALDVQTIRAPFTGTLTRLGAMIGERVASGTVVGAIVSQSSEAAVNGAQAMLGAARTPAERSDAERALALARQNIVTTPLRAPRGGTVTSRPAAQGDLVNQGDSILSIAAAGSIVFVARIAQADLPHVFPGQRSMIALPGQLSPVEGVVHGLLPTDTSGSMNVPVRIDLRGAPVTGGAPIQAGLFGTAQIVTGEHTGVPTIPAASVLRDDISGISRVAIVTADGTAHWVTVTTGPMQDDRIEVISPRLTAGQRVIVTGQVGLPEGSRIRDGGGLPGSSGDTTGSAAGRATTAPAP